MILLAEKKINRSNIIVIIVILIFLFSGCSALSNDDAHIQIQDEINKISVDDSGPYQTVAEINGIPVALGELQLFVDDFRELTKSYFKKTYNLESLKSDQWNTEFGDNNETPIEFAIGLALNKLIPYKVTQKELLDQGKLDDISYKTFVDNWETENKSRKEKKEAGGIIYGPIQYTKQVYYDYLYDEQKNKLKKIIQGIPNDTELRKIYNDNPDMFYDLGKVTMQCVILPQSEYSEDEAAAFLDEINQSLSEGNTFEQASQHISNYVQKRVFTADDISTPDVSEFVQIHDAIYYLPVSSTTDLIVNGDIQWIFLYCQNRSDNGRKSFEQCKDVLNAMYLEQYFDMTFEKMIESAQIITYQNAKLLIK